MRTQPLLPEDEIRFLESLPTPQLHTRLAHLHAHGWSLSTIARSLNPPKPKTTVHYWIQNAATDAEQRRALPEPPPTSLTMAVPTYKAPRTRSVSPNVPPDIRPKLRELSEKSKRFRAKTPKGSETARANQELTKIALELHAHGVPTSKIAAAAGVTYRAMARRIASGTKMHDETA
jgi:hypothetical protein